MQLPRKHSENFNKKLRDTLMGPNSGRLNNGFKTKFITTAETPKKYLKMSKRLYFRRRYHMRNKPLMIIYFEGVLGFIAN